MRRIALALLVAAVSWAQEEPPPPPEGAAPPPPAEATPAPEATTHRYWGYHPVPPSHGSFCATTGLHAHAYAPFDAVLFVVHDGYWVFVGDPFAFGYSGGVYLYSGHHPHGWGGWCYLDGQHHHLFAPFGTFFVLHGHHHVFHGPHDGHYRQHRPRHLHHHHGVDRDRARPPAHYSAPPRRTTVPLSPTRPVRVTAPPVRAKRGGR